MQKIFLPLYLAMILSAIGCITFRKGELKKYHKAPVQDIKINEKIDINYSGKIMGGIYDQTSAYKKLFWTEPDDVWIKSLNRAFIESKIFSDVKIYKKYKKNNSGYSIDVKYVEKVDPLPVCIFPFNYIAFLKFKYRIIDLNVTAEIRKQNRIIRVYKFKESINRWYGFIFFLGMPFTDMEETKGHQGMLDNIYYDLNMAIIKKAYKDGVFTKEFLKGNSFFDDNPPLK